MTYSTLRGTRCSGSFGRRMHLAFAGALLASWLPQVQGATSPPDYVIRAIADTGRPAEQIKLDAWRKPAAVIGFSGLKPGDRVADFMPGNAYFTRMFSRVVGPNGRVYAFLPTQELANCAPGETEGTRVLQRDGRYKNITVLIDAADRFAAPEPLDMVWTTQNYHDLSDSFMKPTDVAAFNRAVFRALKPGGVFLVIDHVAAAGSGLRDTERLHRIDPEAVRTEVTAAGFVLEAQSNVLRNPEDAHTLKVFDPAIRHRTDQIVYRFRKPAQ